MSSPLQALDITTLKALHICMYPDVLCHVISFWKLLILFTLPKYYAFPVQ